MLCVCVCVWCVCTHTLHIYIHIHRQTDRPVGRQTDRQTDKTDRDRDRDRDRVRDRDRDRDRDRGRHTNTHTHITSFIRASSRIRCFFLNLLPRYLHALPIHTYMHACIHTCMYICHLFHPRLLSHPLLLGLFPFLLLTHTRPHPHTSDANPSVRRVALRANTHTHT